MSFFRRKPQLLAPVARLATPDDRQQLARFVHMVDRRYLTSGIAELPPLFAADPTAVAELDGRLVAAASFGWRAHPVAWLRTVLIDGHIDVESTLSALLPPLYCALQADGIEHAAITVDEWSEPWLRRPLIRLGYEPMVEVIGYEKSRWDRPAGGNQIVQLRRAVAEDLPAVLELDRQCFPLPWVKGGEIFEPAIRGSPCFIIAEFGGQPIGYAFLTAHHGGQLFHLVRIAVSPRFRGRGAGVRLLTEIVDFCHARNAGALTLNTQADNYTAQRLYQWFGFTPTGERQTVLGRSIIGY